MIPLAWGWGSQSPLFGQEGTFLPLRESGADHATPFLPKKSGKRSEVGLNLLRGMGNRRGEGAEGSGVPQSADIRCSWQSGSEEHVKSLLLSLPSIPRGVGSEG